MFTCKWFLTFQRFVLKLNKKAQSPEVLDFTILHPGFWAMSLESQFPGSRSWHQGFGFCVLGFKVLSARSIVLDPGFRVLGFRVLGPGSCILVPRSWVLSPGSWSWAFVSDYANNVLWIVCPEELKIVYFYMIRYSHQRCSLKKMFWEILQYSQENTCARVSFQIELQA